MLTTLISDGLWLVIFAGWVLLFISGLEADKPLSGGIPGHSHDEIHPQNGHLHFGDSLGNIGSWALFIFISLLLPLLLWWIFVIHPA